MYRGRHHRPVLASFRPTWRQALTRGISLGGLGSLVLGVLAVGWVASAGTTGSALPDALAGRIPGAGAPHGFAWLAVLAPLPLGLVGGTAVRLRIGARLDERGVQSLSLGFAGFAPWRLVIDVRAERRRGRTVVAVYLGDGTMLRLRAPYDGALLGRDPRFEQKLFTICNLWETHRDWSVHR